MISKVHVTSLFRISTSVLFTLLMLCFVSCQDKELDGGNGSSGDKDVKTVDCTEVIYYHVGEEEKTQKLIDYALEKINAAQEGLPFKVNMTFELVPEEGERFEATASYYLMPNDYGTIIAPENADKAMAVIRIAEKCKSHAIILPNMTSNEVQRNAAAMGHVHCLTNDDRQVFSIALRQLHASGNKHINLVYSNDAYGQTFSRFFPLYASTAGYSWVTSTPGQTNGLIPVSADISNQDFVKTLCEARENFRKTLKDDQMDDYADYTNYVVASSNPEHAFLVDSLVNVWKQDISSPDYVKTRPHVAVIGAEQSLYQEERFNNVLAYATSPDPYQKEFAKDFLDHFGYYPIHGEAFIYDAIQMAFYIEYIRYYYYYREKNSNDAEKKLPDSAGVLQYILTEGKDEVGADWSAEGIHKALEAYIDNKDVSLHGVTSDWDESFTTNYAVYFVSKDVTQYNHLIPVYWVIDEADGDYRIISNAMAHEWDPNSEFDNSIFGKEEEKPVPELHDRWALLISGTLSDENNIWYTNYRHQGDVWNMYHLLRNHGYDENHIIVVTEDDIFGHGLFDEAADEKVVKFLSNDKETNLYEDIKAHYKTSKLTQQDIIDIITGNRERNSDLQYVIESTEHDNIFVYWSGHGKKGGILRWDGANDADLARKDQGYFYPKMLYSAFDSMKKTENTSARYRRLFFVLEACYSGSFINQLPHLDNALYLSAAEDESSWSDPENRIELSDDNGKKIDDLYLFDRFSANFVKILTANPNITMSSLFTTIYDNTTDSHASVANAANYGDLYKLTFNKDYMDK